ncbi:hypothetical protein K1T71_011346 [Dendrolimus kikuchii]|uniref:Uncharacterized protein n=1 Tax=Dendrolimus kikuchii TaxID=765133 RepID=A0ACC1CNT6_9NEOP|nr:hypothetical protein K1T71_011346 [Dendrolimus kikuchii]
MAPIARAYDSVHFYMSGFTSRVVAKSGIPGDRYHLGKLILQGLRDDPDFVLQIDGATDELETNGSVLDRTIRCAISMQNMGLKKGDVIVLIAPNHIHQCIPMYAALNLGIIVAPLDITLGVKELERYFANMEPKLIFCQSDKTETLKKALENIDLPTTIVTFDKGVEFNNFSEFMIKYSSGNQVKDFQSTDLDTENTVAYLTPTSGTTGMPKAVALSHKNLATSVSYVWSNFTTFPTPTKMAIVVSPLIWLSATFHFLFNPILKFTRLQSSKPMAQEHFVHLVNKYRPTYTIISPTLMSTIIKPGNSVKCDFTSFEHILLGGSYVSKELLDDIKKVTPRTYAAPMYGMSEVGGFAFLEGTQSSGSVGRPMGCFDYRLVNVDTLEDIEEPNVNGELWFRGPAVCMGYYRNEEVTKASFSDGWLRSGDIFYTDENGLFYFVDRLKLLLKYRNYQISPTEVENVIRQHPGVLDVAVTGIQDQECGDLAVACVVPRPGYKVNAQEIKDLVKENLSDTKQLRGGVIFMNEFPMTPTTKTNRILLKQIVRDMARE